MLVLIKQTKDDYIFNSDNKTVILFRIHKLKPHQLSLIHKISDEIINRYDCILLSDDNDFNVTVNNCINTIITYDDVINIYPSIYNINNKKCNPHNILSKEIFFWAFNTEQLYLWYKKYGKTYQYVWIFEQDIGFSGNINYFLKEYDNDYSDLIISNYIKVNDSWPYSKCATSNYLNYLELHLGKSMVYQTYVFIQRYSNKLFNILREYLNNKFHRHSEASSIEAALMENLSINIINKKYIGDIFDWNGRVSRSTWIKILNHDENRNKLYHALKF